MYADIIEGLIFDAVHDSLILSLHYLLLYKSLIQQLFPECLIYQTKPTDTLDNSPWTHHYEQNVKEIGYVVSLCTDKL